MNILIPAAGEGLRLRPHTLTRPKPLLRIAGKTVIDFVLEPLLALQPHDIALVVGYRGQQLIEYLTDRYHRSFTMVEQDQLLGLGYAVLLGLEALDPDEDVLIILADTIIQTDFREFVAAGENTLALREVDDPRRFGVAETDNGRITRLVEKPADPQSNLAVVGLYYFKNPRPVKRALRSLVQSGRTSAGEVQLTDALQDMIQSGEPFTPHLIDGWLDCGKHETMLSTSRTLLADMAHQPPQRPGVTWRTPTLIDPSARVSNSTIGPNVTLYPGCEIIDSTLENCIIGPGCKLTDCSLADSILGERVTLAGVSGTVDIGDGGLTLADWEKQQQAGRPE
ncbi:MAG TPA: sugar phosphate nucleotidyltransferase [candidate division Zixibacteria bacterium]|nr:sugar phosphate nucleotidyltransferase [candidate division Zixibacteria bacterium]